MIGHKNEINKANISRYLKKNKLDVIFVTLFFIWIQEHEKTIKFKISIQKKTTTNNTNIRKKMINIGNENNKVFLCFHDKKLYRKNA